MSLYQNYVFCLVLFSFWCDVSQAGSDEKVKIQVFYESLSIGCRIFAVDYLVPAMDKLGDHLDIYTYPYGKAHTVEHDNGTFEIICQNGEKECFGNMLHACAIDLVKNYTQALYFNACTMRKERKNNGSNDEAADTCGKEFNIDPEPIKACAKSQRGLDLQKHYGEETKKNVFLIAVPFVAINDTVYDFNNSFIQVICKAFQHKPKECQD